MKSPRSGFTLIELLVVIALLLAGCSAEEELPSRRAVSGRVLFEGGPLDHGSIEFQPASPGAATMGGAAIEDGDFQIPAEEGLLPGTYRLVVSSTPEGLAPAEGEFPGETPPPAKDPIPARYNSQTRLTFEVKAEGENIVELELKSR